MSAVFSIVGKIVVYALAAGVIITLIELIRYRLPGSEKGRTSDEVHISIITGASSGLGSRYALRLDRILPEGDEIWLIARRKDRLEQLAARLSHRTRCLSFDLSKPESAEEITELIENARSEGSAVIRWLVNCAGYGKIGKIEEMSADHQEGMVDLNCTAGMRMVNVCLPFMTRGSHIMNVCSTAGFQPFQNLNIYASTKAFFLRYTRALRMELLSKGVIVTAVCPYWIRDTEFIGIAGPEKKADIRSFPLSSKVSSVAAVSLFGSRIGLPVVTPGIVCTFHRFFSKLFPDTVLVYIWEGLRRI